MTYTQNGLVNLLIDSFDHIYDKMPKLLGLFIRKL